MVLCCYEVACLILRTYLPDTRHELDKFNSSSGIVVAGCKVSFCFPSGTPEVLGVTSHLYTLSVGL